MNASCIRAASGSIGRKLLRVRDVRLGRLDGDAGTVPLRQLAGRIVDVPARAPADGEDRAGRGTRADEDVLRPRRAVDEVPLLQTPFLALDQEQALAREDEEVLLVFLAVVHARGLSRFEHSDVDPELREAGIALESRVRAVVAVEPARLAGVDDKPAFAFGCETLAGAFERRFRNHRPILAARDAAGAAVDAIAPPADHLPAAR